MNKSENISHVHLNGAWPSGTIDELQQTLGDEFAFECDSETKAMMPWADIGSLVSAAAAVVTTVVMLWGKYKNRSELESPELETVNDAVRAHGIFSIAVVSAAKDCQGKVITIEVRENTSNSSYKFEVEDNPSESRMSLILKK